MKRFISLVLCFLFLFSNFCLVSFAYDESELYLWDFILGYYNSTYYTNHIANDPDKLIDFYSTTPGKLVTLSNLYVASSFTSPVLAQFVAKKNLDTAVTSRYIASEVDRDFVEALDADCVDLASRNGHRAYTFEQLHLSTTDPITTDYLRAIGSPPINNIGTKWNNDGNLQTGYYSVGYPNDSTISFYCGGDFPPCFYVPKNCDVFQDGVSLGTGFYLILGDNLLLKNQSGYESGVYNFGASNGRLSFYYFGGSSSTSVTFGIARGQLTTTGKIPGRCENAPILSSGRIIGLINSGSYDGATVTDLVEKMCGFYVYPPSYVDETPQTFLPDNVPYEDNRVVIMVPIDEPSEPIYMSPSTYNTYVENGDIYNVDDHSINNNVVNNDTVNNIYNIYNNYVTNNNVSDDKTLMDKLNTIITKLNDIYYTIKNIDLSPTVIIKNFSEAFNPEPSYVDFGDCITDNLPISNDIKNLIDSINVSSSSSGFDTVTSSTKGSKGSQIENLYGNFSLDLSWYAPYRTDVRNVLKIFCYILGIGGIWSSVKSVFGIHQGGGS